MTATKIIRHVVEVNDCLIVATGQGREWWATYQIRHANTGRIVWVDMTIGGGLAHIPCDDREDADEVRAMLLDHGIHPKAAKIKKLVADAPTEETETDE
jgi:hypothetical protein